MAIIPQTSLTCFHPIQRNGENHRAQFVSQINQSRLWSVLLPYSPSLGMRLFTLFPLASFITSFLMWYSTIPLTFSDRAGLICSRLIWLEQPKLINTGRCGLTYHFAICTYITRTHTHTHTRTGPLFPGKIKNDGYYFGEEMGKEARYKKEKKGGGETGNNDERELQLFLCCAHVCFR